MISFAPANRGTVISHRSKLCWLEWYSINDEFVGIESMYVDRSSSEERVSKLRQMSSKSGCRSMLRSICPIRLHTGEYICSAATSNR